MKTAKEFWKDKFDELPQNKFEKLAIAMMAEYASYVSSQPPQNQTTEAIDLSDLLAVYNRYKHLDSVFMLNADFNPHRQVDEENDPFHIAALDFWMAIKKTLKY